MATVQKNLISAALPPMEKNALAVLHSIEQEANSNDVNGDVSCATDHGKLAWPSSMCHKTLQFSCAFSRRNFQPSCVHLATQRHHVLDTQCQRHLAESLFQGRVGKVETGSGCASQQQTCLQIQVAGKQFADTPSKQGWQ